MPAILQELTSNFHETNIRLRSLLDELCPLNGGEAPARVITPEEIAGLLSELMRAGGWLRSLPNDNDAALGHELAHYREQVERLRDLMPSLHEALLRERARLEQERKRLTSASQWAEGSRQTL